MISSQIKKQNLWQAFCVASLNQEKLSQEDCLNFFEKVVHMKNQVGKYEFLDFLFYRIDCSNIFFDTKVLSLGLDNPKILGLLLKLKYNTNDLTFVLKDLDFSHWESYSLCLKDERFRNIEILNSLIEKNFMYEKGCVYYKIKTSF